MSSHTESTFHATWHSFTKAIPSLCTFSQQCSPTLTPSTNSSLQRHCLHTDSRQHFPSHSTGQPLIHRAPALPFQIQPHRSTKWNHQCFLFPLPLPESFNSSHSTSLWLDPIFLFLSFHNSIHASSLKKKDRRYENFRSLKLTQWYIMFKHMRLLKITKK